MSETDQSNGFDSQPDQIPAPDHIQFCSIEELQEASEADGWSVEYRQIQPGDLKTQQIRYICDVDTLSILRQSSSLTKTLSNCGHALQDCT